MESLFKLLNVRHETRRSAREFLKYIGPGILITVGFIDPGNWASNMAAGAEYGYALLWMVTLSTIMLIILQHNAAHLGIVSGECLSEAAAKYLPKGWSRLLLSSAVLASAATALAEILGGAIALSMLFHLPLTIGAVFTALCCGWLLWSNSYRKLEKIIIAFVSLIGLSFLAEICFVSTDWPLAAAGWVTPSLPAGALVVVTSVLGAVVMPHNLFLHSEVIQSRQWNLEDEAVIQRQLKYEFLDTLLSMGIGWAINSAMIILAAAAFWAAGQSVSELEQAQELLRPLLGSSAADIFAVALLLAGVASAVTSGMAGGIMSSGMAGEPYNIRDKHSLIGVAGSLLLGLAIIWFVSDPFQGLLLSQMALSVQLPITMAAQVWLTSSPTVMGKYANGPWTKALLLLLTAVVTALNIALFISAVGG